MVRSKQYDYIILGAGCAGLSLLTRILRHADLKEKRILLIDRSPKNTNDRTWCYWEKGKGFFEEIVYRRWENIEVVGESDSNKINISPYQYKMIRGIDFYEYCFQEIRQRANVEIVTAEISNIEWEKPDALLLWLNGQPFKIAGNAIVFDSIYRPKDRKSEINLLQHFKGWIIETPRPTFDPAKATLMDFRVSQKHGTSFGYVLPLDAFRALAEFTVFSPSLLQQNTYDVELRYYIEKILGIEEYAITGDEFGVIPMTTSKSDTSGWPIGTAGGQTKPSSGYTFQFIQHQSDEIVNFLATRKNLNYLSKTPRRFRFYDRIFLRVLRDEPQKGKEIFQALFKRNQVHKVLRFLDNESDITEEAGIIMSLPKQPFLKALFARD